LTDAREFAEKLEIPLKFENEMKVRPRKVKIQFSYETNDEPIEDGKESFKVNFFFVVLDRAVSSLSERFDQLKNNSDNFRFLYIHELKQWEREKLQESCRNPHSVLTDDNIVLTVMLMAT
jgi:hypothetical protein